MLIIGRKLWCLFLLFLILIAFVPCLTRTLLWNGEGDGSILILPQSYVISNCYDFTFEQIFNRYKVIEKTVSIY
jgi:hypothetical protein